MLQRSDADFIALSGGDALGGGISRGQRGDGCDAMSHGGAANGLVVKEWIYAIGRIYDELNLAALDEIDDVGTPFFHFVNTINRETRGFNHIRRPLRGDDLEAKIGEALRHRGDVTLVMIVHADEDASAGGQNLAGSELSFGEGFAEIVSDAHHLASRLHLWAKHGIDPGELVPRKYRRFHKEMVASVQDRSALHVLR